MKELEAFSIKDLRTAERVLAILESNGRGIDELARFNNSVGQERVGGKTGNVKSPILFPGEVEESDGILCANCHSAMYNEGICGKSVAIMGCVRMLYCSECGLEVKIR